MKYVAGESALTLHKYSARDFTLVQNRFLDEYMIPANGEFVKIYLYLLRCSEAERELSLASIADAFNYTESDVKRALSYWEKQNLLRLAYSADGALTDIILSDGALPKGSADPVPAALEASDRAQDVRETHRITMSADRKRELASNEEVRRAIYTAEQYLGKKLSSTEVTHILYFYDELHFSADLIAYLIEYCVSKGKRSISYILAVALEWAARGITTEEEAKKDTNLFNKNFYAVLNAFGIRDRGPAQMEVKWMNRWFQDFQFTPDIVLEACHRTISRTHAPNFQYADRILESWHESGVKSFEDIKELDRPAPEKPQKKAPAKSAAPSGNKFNNFPQRKYDYKKLENSLLGCAGGNRATE